MRPASFNNGMLHLPPWATGVVLGLVVLVPAVFVLSIVHSRSNEAIRDEIRGNLRRLAKSAAVHVDPELHKTFTDRSQESSEEYAQAIAPLARFASSDASIVYVYTVVLREGDVYFVLDPTEEGDRDDDGMDDKSHVMQQYDDPTPEMLNAFKFRASTAESEPNKDDWGTFISGYAPILDDQHNLVAVLGVDLAADRYAARIAGVNSAAFVGYIVAFVIAALIGVLAALVHRRRQLALAEERKASEALSELALSLESANGQLRFASKRFEQLFNLIPVACFTFDKNGTIYEWNKECERLTGRQAHEVVQKTVFETVVSEYNHPRFHEMIETVFRDRQMPDWEWTDLSKSGSEYVVVVNTFPLYAPDGTVTGGIAACADVTAHKELQAQNEKAMSEIQRAYSDLDASRNDLSSINEALSDANRQLRKLASVDPLTDILNRRSIFKTLEREATIAMRRSRPLSVMMVDIDHFKALNDTHGHLVGDSVLKAVANRLKTASRMADQAGRFGGEEFLVVLPDTDEEDAIRVAERVRKQIASMEGVEASVTVSIGVSTYLSDMGTIEHLIDAADRALYEAKRNGRNRVVHSRDLASAA